MANFFKKMVDKLSGYSDEELTMTTITDMKRSRPSSFRSRLI